MRAALVIAGKELKLRFRDRSAIIFAFVAPLVLALIISFAFRSDTGFEPTFVSANLDQGDLGRTFLSAVEQGLGDALTMKETRSFEEAREMIEKEEASSAFLIPEGFSSSVQNGQPAEIKVLKSANAPISGEVATAFAEGFITEINAGRLAVATAVQAGALEKSDSQGLQSLIQKAVTERIPIQLIQGKIQGTEVNSASYFGPAMAIFFLSFTVQFGTLGILSERREGTLSRMFAAPISVASILGGKLLGAFMLGMISLLVMNVATSLMLGASWGPTTGVLLLGAGAIFAFMGVSAIGASFARTEEAAQGFVGIVMSLFALLGGNFIPINGAPVLVQQLSLGTPNGWALRGFIDLSTGGGLASIVNPLIVLGVIGTLTFSIGALRGRRLLIR